MDRKMLLPTLAVLVLPWLKPELQKMPCIIQKKMEQNENGRQSSLGLVQKITAHRPKFHYVTLASDDSLTIQTHKVMLVNNSTVFEGLLRKHSQPYPLAYMSGGGTNTQFEDQKG